MRGPPRVLRPPDEIAETAESLDETLLPTSMYFLADGAATNLRIRKHAGLG